MKLRVLLSILFIVATTFTALHELEHVYGGSDSSTCEVCIVDNHAFSDVVDNVFGKTFTLYSTYTLKNQLSISHIKKTTNHSNAPPKQS